MPDFESIADRQIREATARGAFDDLPGKGRPIPDLRDDDPNWWVKSFLERERLDDEQRAAYEAIERRVGSLWRLPSESAVRRRVAELNEQVDELNATGRSRRFQPFDADEVAATWKQMVRARTSR